MKNQLLAIFASLFILSACDISSEPADETNGGREELSNNNSVATPNEDSVGSIETTGAFEYFPKEGPSHFTQTAAGRVCFTPAQLDTTNEGNMFCFTNTEEALEGLRIEADETCERYLGIAKVEIKNLTKDVPSGLKSDACLEDGSCKFNEAEFVEVQEMIDSAKCETDQNETESKNSITLKEEELVINLPTDFETQENGTWFGLKGAQPGTKDYYLYNFSLVEKRTFDELMTKEKGQGENPFIGLEPAKLAVNGLSVVKWYEKPMGGCEVTYLEILGKEKNIQFTNSHGCHGDRETNFDYLEDVIEDIKKI